MLKDEMAWVEEIARKIAKETVNELTKPIAREVTDDSMAEVDRRIDRKIAEAIKHLTPGPVAAMKTTKVTETAGVKPAKEK